jgi:hypothetical protein
VGVERWVALLWAVALVTGCGDPAVLEVGRIGYTEAELADVDPRQREVLVDLTAFGAAAADQRLDEAARPLVLRDLRSILLQRAALEIGASAAGLDDDALRELYAEEPEYELQVRHLVVLSERWRTQAHRDSAAARAEAAVERARAGDSFEALAAEYSDEPGAAERGGLLQPGREGSWVPEFWEAARALDPGEVSGVVETEYGFHVVRLESRDTIPYEEARGRVLERSLTLADAFAGSARWIEERARHAVVDTPAVEAWLEGRVPATPLVRWSGTELSPYEAQDLDEYAISLPPEQREMLERGGLDQAVVMVEAAARNNAILDYARSMGIEATPPQRRAVEQQWSHRLGGWAEALGFAPGMNDRALKSAALAALGEGRQEALRARSEIRQLSRALRSMYPVQERL